MRRLVVAVLAVLAFTGVAFAQNYPSHPITIIVPFSAGGPSDAMARILAERMKTSLGEAILIENVTGAGGSIGVGRAVRSAAGWLHHLASAISAPTSPMARSTSSATTSSATSSRWRCCRAIP